MAQQQFDQEQAIEILNAFERVSGLGGTLFIPGEDGVRVKVLYSRNACAGKCPFCMANEGYLQNALEHGAPLDWPIALPLWGPQCQKVHNQAADFAERFGGRYFYMCGQDRLFFAAPIIADAGLVGALTVGPVHIYTETSRTLDPKLRPFPVREPAYLQYLSDLLSACAVSVSDSSQSLLRMMRQITMDQQREIHGVLSRSKKTPVKEYSITLEESLVDAVRRGEASAARRHLNELLGMLQAAYYAGDLGTFADRIAELVTVCSRAALKAGVATETVFGVSHDYRKKLAAARTKEQQRYCIERCVEQLTALVERLQDINYADDVYRATEFILANYNRKITLEDVADEVGFSPAYFSRLFKKKYGQSFSAFLTNVRIDASKNNLLATNLPMSEIARMSGFVDASYFTRAFKREVGVTPGYFRSHRGQVERSKELNLRDR